MSKEISSESYLNKEEINEFIAVIKRYVNLPKILMFIDKTIASEFIKKQDYFFQLKNKNNKDFKMPCCGDDYNPLNGESKTLIFSSFNRKGKYE